MVPDMVMVKECSIATSPTVRRRAVFVGNFLSPSMTWNYLPSTLCVMRINISTLRRRRLPCMYNTANPRSPHSNTRKVMSYPLPCVHRDVVFLPHNVTSNSLPTPCGENNIFGRRPPPTSASTSVLRSCQEFCEYGRWGRGRGNSM